jgi:hypothetical protein
MIHFSNYSLMISGLEFTFTARWRQICRRVTAYSELPPRVISFILCHGRQEGLGIRRSGPVVINVLG